MREQGIVLADGHDCETMARGARGRERELDAKVERHKAEYARLPKDVLQKDAEIAWGEAASAARRAPKAVPVKVEA